MSKNNILYTLMFVAGILFGLWLITKFIGWLPLMLLVLVGCFLWYKRG